MLFGVPKRVAAHRRETLQRRQARPKEARAEKNIHLK